MGVPARSSFGAQEALALALRPPGAQARGGEKALDDLAIAHRMSALGGAEVKLGGGDAADAYVVGP